jgi:hypothetical protein
MVRFNVLYSNKKKSENIFRQKIHHSALNKSYFYFISQVYY